MEEIIHTLLFKRRKNHEKVRETYCKELTRLRLVQKYMLLDRVRCSMSTRRTKQIRSTVTKILV